MENYNSSGIREKRNLKTGVPRKQSALNFQKKKKKTNIFYSLRVRIRG